MSEHGDLANRVDFVRRWTLEKKCFIFKQSFKTAVENITDVLAGKIQTLE